MAAINYLAGDKMETTSIPFNNPLSSGLRQFLIAYREMRLIPGHSASKPNP